MKNVDFGHPTYACKSQAKCLNCNKSHVSKSNECDIWKKEKKIMKIKITQKVTYLEAKKIQENQPEITFANVVQSLNSKKILSFNKIQKSLLLLQNLNLNLHLPISLDHKQDLHLKPVYNHRSKWITSLIQVKDSRY